MTIQKLLMPLNRPENIDVFYYPADYIGGDLIIVNEYWSCIVDVSGHGVSSALIGSGLRVIIGEVLTAGLHIQDLGNILEERFKEFGNVDMFFTGIFAKQVPGGVEMVSFGHPAPIKISGERIEILDIHYDVLIGWGKVHSSVYRFEPLTAGESILLYSDGLTEIAVNGEFLGEKGLMGILTEIVKPREIYIRAMEKSDENTHKDDISLVVIHGLSAESV
jgi:serine phosphatase RsbU (regulator of sigma subunit)